MIRTNHGENAENLYPSTTSKTKNSGIVSIVAGSIVLGLLSFSSLTPAVAAEPVIMLETAGNYSVLAGSTVTNTGPSVLNQNLGLHPGTAVVGFPPGIVNGALNVNNGPALTAQTDLTIAYNDAEGRPATATLPEQLAGQTLVGGVYDSSTGPLLLDGALTLDGQNDPSSVFIFQSASTLITGAASQINLINGAQACNIFWQVGSSATLGSGSSFVGTVMALTSITAETGATIDGRLLARNGAVTLDTNVFTAPGCDMTPIPTVTPTTTPTPTPTAVTPVIPVVTETPTVPVNRVTTDTPTIPVHKTTTETPTGSSTEGTVTETESGTPPNEDERTPTAAEYELAKTGANSMTPLFAITGLFLLFAGLGLLFGGRVKPQH